MQAENILYIIIFLFGITIGSFLNVLIYRIPLKENIVTTSSHCMACGRKIQWYDLIPLASYMVLRGKCRYCKTKISVQYPLVEAFNGIGYVFIFAVNGFSWLSILYCLMFSIFIVISVIDFRTYEIPMALNIAVFVLGVIRLLLEPHKGLEQVAGFFIISVPMLLILFAGRKLKGIDAFGGGDIKLMAAAGLFTGAKNVVLAFVLGCILGAVIHSVRMRISQEDHVLAFGPYLCAGLLLAMLYGNQMISWYLGLLG